MIMQVAFVTCCTKFVNYSCNADIDECAPNRGRGPCAQMCTNTIGSFYCSCQPGYNLSGYACNGIFNDTKYLFVTWSILCPDINECTLGISGCSQICINTIGSYVCECLIGYELSMDNATCDGEALLEQIWSGMLCCRAC